MNSNSNQSTPSNKKITHTNGYHPVDDCRHLISTSLRDLSSEYKHLGPEDSDPSKLSKKNPVKKAQMAKSDAAHL